MRVHACKQRVSAFRPKPGSICVAAVMFWGHRFLKFVVLVGINGYVNGISMKFVGKTTKHARIRLVKGVLPHHRLRSASYKSGTHCCIKYRTEIPKGLKNWSQLEEEFTEVLSYYKISNFKDTLIQEGWQNKIFPFHIYFFFISSHNFKLLQFFILFLAPPKCKNCFKLVAKVLGFARDDTKI